MDSWTHLVAMLFPQFANIHSLRDISNGLRSITGNLNHLGIKSAPSKYRLYEKNLPEDRHTHILIDEAIELKKDKTRKKYPKRLQCIAVYHEENHNVIEIIINNFTWTAVVEFI